MYMLLDIVFRVSLTLRKKIRQSTPPKKNPRKKTKQTKKPEKKDNFSWLNLELFKYRFFMLLNYRNLNFTNNQVDGTILFLSFFLSF